MMFDSEQVVWVIVLAGLIGFVTVTGAALFRAAVDADLGRRRAWGVAAGAVAVMAAWAAVAAALADAGAFRQSSAAFQPWFVLTILAVFAVLLLSTAIPALSRVTRNPMLLTWPQTIRVVGVVFLIAWAAGDLPAVFALPAGLGDIAVGIAAVWLIRSGRSPRSFHLLGLLDLVVAVGVGFLAGLGPSSLLDVTPSMDAVTRLPLMLIPVVLVPLAATLHIQALRGLRATTPALAVAA